VSGAGVAWLVGDEKSAQGSKQMRATTMNLSRRKLLHLAAGAAALPALPRVASALDYPARPVRLILQTAPGGTADIVARLIGQWLSERLRQPFVIENRPGASGNIGTEMVVRAAPDGYSLLIAASNNPINVTFYDTLNFNFLRDIAPVAGIMRTPMVMEVNPASAIKSVPEFIAYAKANPGKMNFGSGGNGFATHLAGELFQAMTGVSLVHVPYRGQALALTDLLAGRIQAMFDPVSSSLAHIEAGELRPLAVTTSARSEALPDVPTVGDFVPGYEASLWFGVGAPRNTPAAVIDKLNTEINAGLADSKLKSQLADIGGTAFTCSPADFGKFIGEETEKWAKVIKFANIKPE
jgi:tripartite-type tricarboxylate transporter receptor subunit TctC